MQLKHIHQYYYLAAVFLMLTACEGMLVPKPQNLEQGILYTQSGLTAAYQTVGDLVVQGRLTAPQRDEAVAQLDKGFEALQTAKIAWRAADTGAATTSLEKARSILLLVESTLKSIKQGAK